MYYKAGFIRMGPPMLFSPIIYHLATFLSLCKTDLSELSYTLGSCLLCVLRALLSYIKFPLCQVWNLQWFAIARRVFWSWISIFQMLTTGTTLASISHETYLIRGGSNAVIIKWLQVCSHCVHQLPCILLMLSWTRYSASQMSSDLRTSAEIVQNKKLECGIC